MYQHDENTEASSQTRPLTTFRLSTYPHSHYSDEPNKEMHTIFIYTTACYTYSKQEQTKLHIIMPNLCTKP